MKIISSRNFPAPAWVALALILWMPGTECGTTTSCMAALTSTSAPKTLTEFMNAS